MPVISTTQARNEKQTPMNAAIHSLRQGIPPNNFPNQGLYHLFFLKPEGMSKASFAACCICFPKAAIQTHYCAHYVPPLYIIPHITLKHSPKGEGFPPFRVLEMKEAN